MQKEIEIYNPSDETIYIIGASLKDAGKRLFAFTQMDSEQISAIKTRL